MLLEKDYLVQKYVVEKMSMRQIASELGIDTTTVFNYLKKYNIPSRTTKEAYKILQDKGWKYPEEAKKTLSKKLKGRKFKQETIDKMSYSASQNGIGHKKKRTDGYIAVYFPDHPCSNKDGYIMEHVLVMECLIGRHLNDNEIVHHKNHNKADNRKSNLQLMTKEEHARMHMIERIERGFKSSGGSKIVLNETTGEIFSSCKEASEKYGIASTNIAKACRNHTKSCGCFWRYKESEVNNI